VLKDLSLEELAVVSYRTIVAFRVAFEFELVRELERLKNPDKDIPNVGKTLYKAFESFLVAFNEDTRNSIIKKTGFTKTYIENKVKEAITKIHKGNIVNTLVPTLKGAASDIIKTYDDLFVPVVNK
jgi:hypothetical protein